MADVLWTDDDTAKRLDTSPRTLARWRSSGVGPPYVRVGPRRIGYLPADVERWAAAHRFTSRAAELIATARTTGHDMPSGRLYEDG